MRANQRRYVWLFCLFAVVTFVAAGTQCAAAAKPSLEELEEQAFKQAAALASQSVVRIQTVGGDDRIGKMLIGTAATTGVVVSPDGYIVSSAFNFIAKPTSILVRLSDGRQKAARTIATDRSRMLTLLKVDVDNLLPIKAARKESVRVGQWAIALGRTYDGLMPSVSVGIVSALDRIWGKALQTDSKISPVNYGGPLVDIEGNALGILVPLSAEKSAENAGVEWYDSGIGFAIPINMAADIMKDLKEHGKVTRGWLGVMIQNLTQDLADSFSLKTTQGALVSDVLPNGPAFKGGLQRGDVIVKFGDQLVENVSELPRLVNDVLNRDQSFRDIAHDLSKARDALFIGRGPLYPIAMEGALKLKEISYIHAEGYAAGELKHGPIALVDEDMPVIVVAPSDELMEKTLSNMHEVAARGGRIVLITDEIGAKSAGPNDMEMIIVPTVDDFVAPILAAIPVQLLAYHTAVHMGTDVDQPRNLAKSVTVE